MQYPIGPTRGWAPQRAGHRNSLETGITLNVCNEQPPHTFHETLHRPVYVSNVGFVVVKIQNTMIYLFSVGSGRHFFTINDVQNKVDLFRIVTWFLSRSLDIKIIRIYKGAICIVGNDFFLPNNSARFSVRTRKKVISPHQRKGKMNIRGR